LGVGLVNNPLSTFLNIGCGKVIIEEKERRWINVDIHGGQIKGNIQNLPFKDNSFDGALASHVLEHILQLRDAMYEIHRILKPDSLFTIRVPYGISSFYDPFHMRIFDFSTFRRFTHDDPRSLEYGKLFEIESQNITDYFIPYEYYSEYWLERIGLLDKLRKPRKPDMRKTNKIPLWKRKELTCILTTLK
jgi:ubiquinone/menaquinone biosynthesis C-methylase UbiE